MSNKKFPILEPDLQVGFFFRLKNIKDIYFNVALSNSIKKLNLGEVDSQLNDLVPAYALNKVASYSLRGEVVFPIPIILEDNPFLLGYYRLLLGFSQKDFYSKGPFGLFRSMEEKGVLSKKCKSHLNELCESLIGSVVLFVDKIGFIDKNIVSELQLLTVGPQLRGSMNNKYGQIATEKTFSIIKEMLQEYVVNSTLTAITVKNDSERTVEIKFSADPDIEIVEFMPSGERGLISIEIKGGKDLSNIHNRIGEAEKSHQKAKGRGYNEFMTIISVDFDYSQLKSESPTTSHFFNLIRLSDKSSLEYKKFTEILSSLIGVRISKYGQ